MSRLRRWSSIPRVPAAHAAVWPTRADAPGRTPVSCKAEPARVRPRLAGVRWRKRRRASAPRRSRRRTRRSRRPPRRGVPQHNRANLRQALKGPWTSGHGSRWPGPAQVWSPEPPEPFVVGAAAAASSGALRRRRRRTRGAGRPRPTRVTTHEFLRPVRTLATEFRTHGVALNVFDPGRPSRLVIRAERAHARTPHP